MGLLDALRVGQTGLRAAQVGLQTAQNNVANVNTPGYARRRANLEEVVLSTHPGLNVFGGAKVTGIEGIRDQVLDRRVANAEAGLAAAETSVGYLSALEGLIAPGGSSGIGDGLSAMFASFERLSVRPEDPSLRADVIDAARTVAGRIGTTANSILQLQSDAQAELALRAGRANELAGSIARINTELAQAGKGTPGRQALIDQQTALVAEIAGEVEVRSYTDQDDMLTVTLTDGTALVAGTQSFALDVDSAPGGAITLKGRDVTSEIQGGAMAGIIAARDAGITPALAQLDTLATAVATEVNQQHRLGFDGMGAAGGDVFTVGPGPQTGSASRGMSVVLSDPSEVAAAATPVPGDGTNAALLAALADKPDAVPAGASATSFSAAVGTLALRAGTDVRSARAEAETTEALREQAVAAREAVSGVSLDEEAADMIRYQRAYQASARFLGTVNDLLGELLNTLGR